MAVQARTPRSGLIRFFNTALGLWLLSTVCISGVGTIYALAKEGWERQRSIETQKLINSNQRAETISKLDLEISFRMSNLLGFVSRSL